jgi:hypothetical protein
MILIASMTFSALDLVHFPPHSANNAKKTEQNASTTTSFTDLPTSQWVSIMVANDPHYVVQGTQIIGLRPIKGADLKSFQISAFEWEFAKDSNCVYYYFEDGCISEADPATFRLFPEKLPDGEFIAVYAIDALHTYYEGRIIVGADRNTFQTLDSSAGQSSGFAKDKNTVFYENIVFSSLLNLRDVEVDASTFAPLFGGSSLTAYSKDRNHVYFETSLASDGDTVEGSFKLVEGADPSTFVSVSGNNSHIDARDDHANYKLGKMAKER